MRMANLNILAAVCLLMTILVVPAGAEIHYVSPPQSIQAAIDDADDYDEIEVAPGNYYEAINFNGKAVRLYSSDGPKVTTIDANGACHAIQCISGENAKTILEGFTITGGNAIGTEPNDFYGGGMYNYNSSPTVTDCNFTNNIAHWNGGGMYNSNSNPTVTNCTFANNSHSGMYNFDNSSPMVTNCTFTNNSARLRGGGMYNLDNSSPIVTNCTFISNSAEMGGGMFNSNSSLTVINCTFTVNSARVYHGGGMYNYNSNLILTNCAFNGNLAYEYGAGIYNSNSSPMVTNCTFTNNSARLRGGGMYNHSSSSTVTNCIFSGNETHVTSLLGGGGGMYNEQSNPTVTNCTFANNLTVVYGGGMLNNESSPMVTNCILWGDLPQEIFDYLAIHPVVSYSNVQGGWSGIGNIDAAPCFVDASGGNFHLLSISPCIDAGNNYSVPADINDLDGDGNTVEPIPLDLNHFPRFIDDLCTTDNGSGTAPIVDMGAYEFLRNDIMGNGNVDFGDFAILADKWSLTSCGVCGGADLTCDGNVGVNDLREFTDWWLAGTEPEF